MPASRPSLAPRSAAVRIIGVLRRAGHVAYLAGGCVRDELLGLPPKDYDVATDAPPDVVLGLFRGARAVGEAFGVVLVRLGGQAIEVATFRSEWGYADRRRPDHVCFTDAQHDAQRRDFTINGLFGDPLDAGGEGRGTRTTGPAGDAPDAASARTPGPGPQALRIIDYVGGRADLAAGVLRAIGEPEQRFAEDYLRMLRAVRFAARLGFRIEAGTAAAIRARAAQLGAISRERIGQELRWMLSGPAPATACALMQELHLDGPALMEEHCSTDPAIVRGLGAAGFVSVLAGWLLDRHLPAPDAAGAAGRPLRSRIESLARAVGNLVSQSAPIRRRWRKALCLTNEESEALQQMLELLPPALAWAGLPVAQRKRLLARTAWPAAAALLRVLAAQRGTPGLVRLIRRQSRPLLEQGVAPAPYLRGDDLVELGFPPGPAFRRILDEAYDRQLDGRLPSRDQALAWARQRQRPAP